MQQWITAMIEEFGYLGMGLLIAVENLFPPIPSEIILTFGGFMTTQTGLRIPGMILYATMGSTAGAVLLYGAGRMIRPEKLEDFLDRPIFRLMVFRRGEVLAAVRDFGEKGQQAVFLGRCVPILRSLVSIPAGMARMDLCRFFWLTTLGSAIWNTVLILLGAAAGASWQLAARFCGTYFRWIKLLFVAAAGIWLLICLYRKKKKQRCGPAE